MAKKLNIMTFTQQVQFEAKVNWRYPQPQPARPLVVAKALPKLTIAITAQIVADTQFPVAIIQVKDNTAAYII